LRCHEASRLTPRHRELKIGLLISKIKAAGLTREEFEGLL